MNLANEMVQSGKMDQKGADQHIKMAKLKYKSEMAACKAELKGKPRVKGPAASAPPAGSRC